MSEEKPSVRPSAPQQPTSKKSWIKWCLVLGIVLICSCPFLVVAAFFLTQASGIDPGKEVLAAVLGKMAITLPLVGFFMELLVWLNVFKNKQRKKRLKTPPPLPERESSNQGGEKIQQTFPTFFQLGRYLQTFKGRGMELAITTLIYVNFPPSYFFTHLCVPIILQCPQPQAFLRLCALQPSLIIP